MDTTCKGAGLFPHPPIMVPEIGGRELSKMALTIETEEKAMKRMVESGIETVVVISPHNLCFYDGPALFIADTISGSLSAFGHPEVSMELSIDRMLSEAILKEAEPSSRSTGWMRRKRRGTGRPSPWTGGPSCPCTTC